MEERDYMTQCPCGADCDERDMARIYDCHGIYVGRRCSHDCSELENWNLNYSHLDAVENGERIDDEY